LIVAFVLGAATPFNPLVGRSGFSELFDLFIVPSFLGAPERELIFGIVVCLKLSVLRPNQLFVRELQMFLSTHVWEIYFLTLFAKTPADGAAIGGRKSDFMQK
jgi:hypothetical protein